MYKKSQQSVWPPQGRSPHPSSSGGLVVIEFVSTSHTLSLIYLVNICSFTYACEKTLQTDNCEEAPQHTNIDSMKGHLLSSGTDDCTGSRGQYRQLHMVTYIDGTDDLVLSMCITRIMCLEANVSGDKRVTPAAGNLPRPRRGDSTRGRGLQPKINHSVHWGQ